MNNYRDIIKAPIITEKSSTLAQNNTYVFSVDVKANKTQIKEAIEKVLHLKVVNLPIDPQLMGALGAAEFARQKGLAK